MTSHFKIIALAFLVTGCSGLQEKYDGLAIPPDVIGDDQLICSSENMILCSGFLTQKDIDNREK